MTDRQSTADGYCQPMDNGRHAPRKFMVVFDDTDQGVAFFDDEAEARAFWKKANVDWNCHLWGTLPLATAEDRLTPEAAWQELVEKDDRTSPENNPGLALISAEELYDFILRAAPGETDRLREAIVGIKTVVDHARKHRGNIGKEGMFLDAVGLRAKAALRGEARNPVPAPATVVPVGDAVRISGEDGDNLSLKWPDKVSLCIEAEGISYSIFDADRGTWVPGLHDANVAQEAAAEEMMAALRPAQQPEEATMGQGEHIEPRDEAGPSGTTLLERAREVLEDDATDKSVWKDHASQDEWIRQTLLPLIRDFAAEHDASGRGVSGQSGKIDESSAALRTAAERIWPYLKFTVGNESPGHHPTMPSAVAAFGHAFGLNATGCPVRADELKEKA